MTTEKIKTQQELNQKFQEYEQQIRQLQQQLQSVEQALKDMNNIDIGLQELKGREGNEILAPVGKGIYAKAKLLSEELTVDIGGKNYIKKSIPDTRRIMQEQIDKLKQVQKELNDNLEEINNELTQTFMNYQKQAQEQKQEQSGKDSE